MKNNSCRYCSIDSDLPILSNEYNKIGNEEYFVFISGNRIILLESSENRFNHLDDIIINYCPVCGIKLSIECTDNSSDDYKDKEENYLIDNSSIINK